MTTNSRLDGEEFLRAAVQGPARVSAVQYDFNEDDQALSDLAHDRVNGGAVLINPRVRDLRP